MQLYKDEIKELKVFNFPYFYHSSLSEEDLKIAIEDKKDYIRRVKGKDNRIGHNWEACVEFFVDKLTKGAEFLEQAHRSRMDKRRITLKLLKPIGERKLFAEVDRVWTICPSPISQPITYVLECKWGLVRKRDLEGFLNVLKWSYDFGVDTPEGRTIKQGVIGIFASTAFNPEEKIAIGNESISLAQIEERKEAIPRAQETAYQVPKLIKSQLPADAWGVLVNVCQHPFLGIRSRCYTLKVSGRRIETAIRELADRHLIVSLEIPLGRFRPVKFLLPTDDALNLLRDFGYDTSLWRKIGNVGFEHSLYQVLIAYSLRKKGYEATIEKKLASGRRLDIYCYDGKRKTGIEIELTTTNIEEKVEGIDELDSLVILVKDEESLRDGIVFLKARPAIKKVSVQKVNEFLRENSTSNRPWNVRHQAPFSGTNPNHDDSGMKA